VKRREGNFGRKVGGAHDASDDAKCELGYSTWIVEKVAKTMYSTANQEPTFDVKINHQVFNAEETNIK
jgi:hypothetical protein